MKPTMDPSISPAVFFDRDGVVNISPGAGYVLRGADFHLMPGICSVLKLCRFHGFKLILVTSQQGVGKGLMSAAELEEIHAKMQKLLAAEGAAFDAIYACPHLAGQCECRKPSPKMILDAARDWKLDLSRSLLVGDQDRDIRMARNAGVPLAIRLINEGDQMAEPADFTVRTIQDLEGCLRKMLVPRQ